MNGSFIARSLVVTTLWIFPLLAVAADPVVSGTTTFFQGDVYRPIDGVQVTVMRKAPAGSDVSRDGGKFSVKYAAGTPVHVLFDVPDGHHVPELQSLSARADLRHDVHVTLFTIDEARKKGINVYAYVKAIVEKLKTAGVLDDSEPLHRLRALMKRVG